MTDTSGTENNRGRKPNVRLNSAKVSQLPESTDNLVDISNSSRFAQWREAQKQAKAQRQDAATSQRADAGGQSPAAPTPLRPRTRAGWNWKKWASLTGALFLAALVFVGVVFFSPLLATRTITVQGASLLDASTVEEQLSPLEGTPMTRITEADVSSLIGNENVLYGVTLEANPPHELVVKLHERVPVAVVEDGGVYVLVDNEGLQLGEAKSVEEAGVPLVAGGLDIVGTPAFETVTGVLAALPTSILSQVSEAKADSASTITLEMADGTQVVWGTPQDSELKAKVLVQLMESVGSEVSVTTYDVSSPLVPTVQ